MGGKQGITVNPERQRQRFTREFKLEAVRLLEFGQKPATDDHGVAAIKQRLATLKERRKM